MCDDTVEIAKDVQATGEANVQIKLSDLNLIDGDHVITVVAEDAAGNKAEEEETTKFAFAVDNTNPVIEASVSGERAEADGFLLYNKQSIEKLSGGVTVKFAVKDVHPVKEGWKLRYKKNGTVGEWEDITLDNDYTYSLTLSEDGTYENFEFKGLDLVGNGSKYSAENIKEIGSETELAFTVESMIIKIVSSEPTIKISLNDDNKDSAYHNEGAFTIHIDSNDSITESKITGFKIIATGGKGSKEKTQSSEGSEPNKTIDVTFEEDEISGICEAEDTIEISVYAVTDFGNSTQKLSAAAGFENAIELKDSNDVVNGNFYYDIKAPEITITYSSENTAYIYKEAPDGYPNITYSAYYAGSVTASFEMEDQNCSDEGMYIDGSESGTSKNIVCEDEVNVFSVYGEDKAGNPANVKEVWSDPDNKVNDRTGEEVVGIVGTFSEGHGKENEYTVRVATVIDKKGPQVSIVVETQIIVFLRIAEFDLACFQTFVVGQKVFPREFRHARAIDQVRVQGHQHLIHAAEKLRYQPEIFVRRRNQKCLNRDFIKLCGQSVLNRNIHRFGKLFFRHIKRFPDFSADINGFRCRILRQCGVHHRAQHQQYTNQLLHRNPPSDH